MVILWPFAGLNLAFLCAAQLLSGLCMTALEGLIDATAAAQATGSVTGALARATAGRALGSAAGTAILPLAIVSVGLSRYTGTVALLLFATMVPVIAMARSAPGGKGHPAVNLRISRASLDHDLAPDLRQPRHHAGAEPALVHHVDAARSVPR
jgi:hypothetical protein